jgi:1-pyrroline-5-carboxylate dehydrogenase
MADTTFRITYATMAADNPELHRRYEEAVERARGWLGQEHPFYVDGEERWGTGFHEERSPIDNEIVIGKFALGTKQDAKDAIAAAKAFAPTWAATPWQERVAIMRRVADIISERVFDYAALMAIEVGKNRLEAMGDVQETADLISYYCDAMERNEGFSKPMGHLSDAEHNQDVLRPFGVWAVISPFNFPMALAGGPAGAALVTGNTVVLKPASAAAFSAHKLYEALRDGGVPTGAIHLITGPGSQVGQEIQDNPDVDGMTFTGSYDVGMGIYRTFAKDYPKPAICEMGGKNPVVVSAKADLDKATDGVMRSAFGFGGQKCSACSRAIVVDSVHDAFVAKLMPAIAKLVNQGDPAQFGTYMGPVASERAMNGILKYIEAGKQEAKLLLGGGRVAGEAGWFVQPTVFDDVAPTAKIAQEEIFGPVLAIIRAKDYDDALRIANDTEFGLTGAVYTKNAAKLQKARDEFFVGNLYLNRKCTGAMVGCHPFGGFNMSGTDSKAGGRDYLLLFLQAKSVAEKIG